MDGDELGKAASSSSAVFVSDVETPNILVPQEDT